MKKPEKREKPEPRTKPRARRARPARRLSMVVIRIYTAGQHRDAACRLAHDAVESIRSNAEVSELTFWERPVLLERTHPDWDGEAAELILGEPT